MSSAASIWPPRSRRLCPIRGDAALTHGQVIAALLCNRLTAPTPLVRVEDWAREWAVEEMLGIPAHLLNDDRIGRALEALADHDEQVVGSIGATATATAIAVFALDLAQVHGDMTSISLHGVYPNAEPDSGYATPRFGHPKDHRTDLLQVQVGLGVTADGGIPVLARAYNGGAAEIAQVEGALRGLRELAGPREFLLVGDRTLVSYRNLTAIDDATVRFLAPAPTSIVPPEALAAASRNVRRSPFWPGWLVGAVPAVARPAEPAAGSTGSPVRACNPHSSRCRCTASTAPSSPSSPAPVPRARPRAVPSV